MQCTRRPQVFFICKPISRTLSRYVGFPVLCTLGNMVSSNLHKYSFKTFQSPTTLKWRARKHFFTNSQSRKSHCSNLHYCSALRHDALPLPRPPYFTAETPNIDKKPYTTCVTSPTNLSSQYCNIFNVHTIFVTWLPLLYYTHQLLEFIPPIIILVVV